jgi:hypothetical protein
VPLTSGDLHFNWRIDRPAIRLAVLGRIEILPSD